MRRYLCERRPAEEEPAWRSHLWTHAPEFDVDYLLSYVLSLMCNSLLSAAFGCQLMIIVLLCCYGSRAGN